MLTGISHVVPFAQMMEASITIERDDQLAGFRISAETLGTKRDLAEAIGRMEQHLETMRHRLIQESVFNDR